MMKIGASTIAAMYVGGAPVSAAYLGGVQVFGGASFDSDALAYITAVETADGEALEAGVKDAINDFVVGCKADAIWDALKASCILAGARTLNGCLVPLKGTAPTNFNFVSADYDRKTGLKGDGSTKYLNSTRANNADPQNNNHNAIWMSDTGPDQVQALIAAGLSNDDGTNLISQGVSNQLFTRNRSSGGTSVSTPIASGFAGTSRSSAASYEARNGGATNTVSVASSSALANNITIFTRLGSLSNYASARLSFYSIGEAIDLAALDARVSALMTALDGAIT